MWMVTLMIAITNSPSKHKVEIKIEISFYLWNITLIYYNGFPIEMLRRNWNMNQSWASGINFFEAWNHCYRNSKEKFKEGSVLSIWNKYFWNMEPLLNYFQFSHFKNWVFCQPLWFSSREDSDHFHNYIHDKLSSLVITK